MKTSNIFAACTYQVPPVHGLRLRVHACIVHALVVEA